MAEIRTKKTSSATFASGIVLGIVLGLVIASVVLGSVQNKINLFSELPFLSAMTKSTSTSSSVQTQSSTNQLSLAENEVKMVIPAVDDNGKGVTTLLKVQAKPGTGKVLIDVNNLFFFVDTQNSIRTAREVAQNISGVDLSKVDLTYSVDANVSAVEGPSAGAALTIGTIAAVEGKPINSSVIITGTINPDGTIGPIGAILEKAQAAKSVGATLFLVPQGQGTTSTYKPVQTCKNLGPLIYCTSDYQGAKTDISSATGITVKEVSTVRDALNYFLV